VRRAISNYRFSVENGLETLSFEEAIEREEERTASFDGSTASVSPFAYLGRGRYADQLAMVGEHFPAAQMQVLVQEQFVANRGAVRALFEFLGVEVGFTPSSIDEVVNASAHAERAEVSAEILARIRSYFREPNARLASEFGADISLWSSESSHV